MGLKSQKRAAASAAHRVFWAALLSIAFHALALGFANFLMRAPPPLKMPPVLHAQLRPLPKKLPAEDERDVLKNTIAESEAAPAPAPPTPPPPPSSAVKTRQAETLPERELEQVLERLSDRVFYPPEAVANGWEGETVLLVEMDGRGNIAGVSVASSSGYAALDDAAIRALSGRRRLGPDLQGKAVLVPIRFELD